MTGDGDRYLIRPATEADLDAIAAFEVEIAVVSFGDEAITDAAFHRRRVANSLGKPGEIALVAPRRTGRRTRSASPSAQHPREPRGERPPTHGTRPASPRRGAARGDAWVGVDVRAD